MHEISKATAVIVNPTHYSVAIRYEMESMAAPLVLAKGKNYLALRIREIAMDHQIPIVENQPLAQALYKSADVGQEIPAHLYRAVAEVLAYIFKTDASARSNRWPPRLVFPWFEASRPRLPVRCPALQRLHPPQTGRGGVNWREFVVPIAVLGIVLAMITPLPPFLLDILI